jgi:hypothetical protein
VVAAGPEATVVCGDMNIARQSKVSSDHAAPVADLDEAGDIGP